MREGMREAHPGIVLGFDFGTRRIGVALGNGITRSARALAVIDRAATTARWREVAALIERWEPQQLVVGVARYSDGQAHEMTARCERFARQLEGRFGLPVARVDERYSSAALARRDARADADDDEAAALILQQWFDEDAQTAC
ncbi:MAG TPA: Holliday junction resolvase RuvX [Burkholderiaceae bacterium]|nr:Holliday junction resolvase RuvX [Burkholderiaceae bacterium]